MTGVTGGAGDNNEANSIDLPLPLDSVESLQQFTAEDVHAKEGWTRRFCRWVPTTPQLLEYAENRILSYVKTPRKGFFVDIGAVEKPSACKWSWKKNDPEPRRIWTLLFHDKEAESSADVLSNSNQCGGSAKPPLPLVLLHGLCASAGLWSLNVDSLTQNHRPVYAIDLLGFGRSSRPAFSADPAEAESQHVEALEAWRSKNNLPKIILVGHSMGAFLSTAYALRYPERVSHLVVVDPWGFPNKPENSGDIIPHNKSIKFRAITAIGQKVNPLSMVRAAGPMGPSMIDKFRPDLIQKFLPLNQDGKASVSEYIYHCNAQKPTGEEAFRTMMDMFGWAKRAMTDRVCGLSPAMPVTAIYGGKTWLQQLPKEELTAKCPPDAKVDVHVVPGAGHHVYVDNIPQFTDIMKKVMEDADNGQNC